MVHTFPTDISQLQRSLPEKRVSLHVDWDAYQTIRQTLGENPSAHLTYYNGILEIMTPLEAHENSSGLIGQFIEILTEELNLNIKSMESTTLDRPGLGDANLNLQQSQGDTQGKVAEGKALVSTAQAVVKQEQARVQEARALVEQARVDSDRYAHLAIEGAETKQRYDVARTFYNTAKAALQSRLAAVEAAQTAVNIAQAKLTQAQTTTLNPGRQQTNVSQLQIQAQQAHNTLAAAQADVKTAQANQQLIQSRLNNLTVKSPIDGVITTRSVEPGTVVLPSRPLPSRPLLRVVDLSQVYLRGFIPGGQIAQVRVGQLANVYLDNDSKHQKSFKATVTAIDSKASFTPENVYFQSDRVQQVFGVKLNLEQPSRLAKPGMPADAEIPLQ
ncbi:HlyD family secretion protein [uncultured Nostoc sp.]|uniref:HlyD family secretion protein n=1 Tax=uncultured Nostoc sp. TaxID=340711 RepID=UPI0035C9ADC8